ncbi:MAG: hypothetical protein PVJ57_03185 [Phycisphaerae bacterium]|jgi:hypothetical protein
MARVMTGWRSLGILGLAVVVLCGLGGCPLDLATQGPEGPEGPEGPAGEQGPTGPAGLDAGATPPETIVAVTAVNGGAAVTPGGAFSVTFTLEDDDGETIDFDDLDRFSIYVSGPASNYQRVIEPEGDADSVTVNDDGSYTYTFADGMPSVYAAPYYDSAAFGTADGEMTGDALMDGTYTVGIEARRTFTVDGASVRKAGDVTADFAIGAATVSPRQLVLQENCNACHAELSAHGENRYKVTGCVLCHTAGSEDRTSSDAAKATTGVSIEFSELIHRLHRGAELREVAATANGADPYHYEVIGYGESVHDYSEIAFPFMPGGTGFNEQMRNCQACHGGATQEAEIYSESNLVRKQCQTCHDDIDFTAGTILDPDNAAVANGTLTKDQLSDAAYRTEPGGITHAAPDGSCTYCHGANQTWGVAAVHVPPAIDPTLAVDPQVVIQSVTGNSGSGFFAVGDTPVVTFQILDQSGTAVDISDYTVNMVIAGPVENYQKIIPAGSTSTVSLKGAGGVPTTGTGPFTYTSPDAIPATYPAPLNDSADFTYADGWGELSGRALGAGSYTVMVYAYRQFTLDGTTYRDTSMPGVYAIRVGSAGTAAAYPGFVTDAKCNDCHGDLRFHGNTRRGVENCVVCHTAGAEDLPTPGSGTQDPAADTIDFKVMIHKIHAARDLYVVQEGGAYDMVGHGNRLQDFSTGWLPSMPGGPAYCAACHATDAWNTPEERDDVGIWMVACTSCHDSPAAAVHVQLNTLAGTFSESCAVCHGSGAAFSVETSHASP